MDDDHASAPPARAPARAGVALAGVATGAVVLALVHPVLEALGRHPEFFVARATPRRDALVVATALTLVVPGLVWAVVALLGRWRVRAGAVAAAVIGAVAGAGLALQVVGGLPTLTALVGATVGAGAVVAVAGHPRSWVVARFGAVVPVLSLAVFLFVLPASRVLWGSTELVAPTTVAQSPVPVVFVIFDELALGTLLEAPDRIDADRFPHFADFADDSIWYRNATTVTDRTSGAVPAILTGQRPAPDALPIAADHPQSIYTLLAGTHDVTGVEPVTDLCAPGVCDAAAVEEGSAPAGLPALVDDVGLVGLHVLLPGAWTRDLPPVDQTWGGFGEVAAPEEAADAGADAANFDLLARVNETALRDRSSELVDVIEPPGDRPPAYVLHTMLPHVPYRHLPTGQATLPVLLAGLREDATWLGDDWLRAHAHRQYLLQAGLADRVLGQVMDDLRTAGLYDEAMIAVVSDHGVSFRADHGRRDVSPATLADIAPVPMMVRYPDGPTGQVDDRPVEVIDLLPTVADLLEIDPARPLDGRSLLDGARRPETRTIAAIDGDLTFEPGEADPWRLGREVQERFGSDWDALYASVPHGEMIGRAVADMDVGAPSGLATVDHRARLSRFTPSSSPIVSVLSGGLAFERPPDEHVDVAVAFDGTIVAVGRTIELDGTTAAYHALLDPSWYAHDVEPIEVYRIVDGDRLQGPLPDPAN